MSIDISSTSFLILSNVSISFDFSVNNNLEAVWYVCGTTNAYETKRGLKALLAKGREYDSNLGLHFANADMYRKILGSATATTPQDTLDDFSVVIDFVRTCAIGSDPKLITDNYIIILLNGCKFNDINITGSPDDIIAQNLSVFVTSAKVYAVDTDTNYKL